MPKRVAAQPDPERLQAILEKQAETLATSFHGTVYRCVTPRWAHPD